MKETFNEIEKEIIKAHMYQKHLWEFMGTTGNMTIISKEGMKKDGFHYEKYLPLEYKKMSHIYSFYQTCTNYLSKLLEKIHPACYTVNAFYSNKHDSLQ